MAPARTASARRPAWVLALLASLSLHAPAAALDTLGISHITSRLTGEVALNQSWVSRVDSTSFVRISRDSIWTPRVDPGIDLVGQPSGLVPHVLMRSEDGFGPVFGTGAMADDDAGTAYAPDSIGISVTRPVVLDLSASLGVTRLRFFPRLDRQHERRFLQEFDVHTSATSLNGPWQSLLSYTEHTPNTSPVVDRTFAPRPVRFVRFTPSSDRPWEIAEVEAFGDGTAPSGLYVSEPLAARKQDVVWGRVRYEGGSIASAPVIVQTRTGPDDEPRLYFERLVAWSDDPISLVQVTQGHYGALKDAYRGPIVASPTWSPWRTTSEGVVRSPSMRKYIQVRVYFPLAGASLHRLVIEYARPPLFHELRAAIQPVYVRPGQLTDFSLCAVAFLDTAGFTTDTGFDQLQVTTVADVVSVDSVLIDDVPVDFAVDLTPGVGFRVDLRRQVLATGVFMEVRFRARLFRDRTPVEVSAVDLRDEDDYSLQVGHAGSVDADGEPGQLMLRFDPSSLPGVLEDVECSAPALTPNGDRVNDTWSVGFHLFHVLDAVPVCLEVYDLGGRLVWRSPRTDLGTGRHRLTWSGRDLSGRLVPPGLHVYRLAVDTATGLRHRVGTVAVVY